jgi:hypothetical protein
VIVSPENDATPELAATVVVPLKVPPPGLVPIATVTFPVKQVAKVPELSRASTVREIPVPADTLEGCAVNVRFVGAQTAVGSEWHCAAKTAAAVRLRTRATRVRRIADNAARIPLLLTGNCDESQNGQAKPLLGPV